MIVRKSEKGHRVPRGWAIAATKRNLNTSRFRRCLDVRRTLRHQPPQASRSWPKTAVHKLRRSRMSSRRSSCSRSSSNNSRSKRRGMTRWIQVITRQGSFHVCSKHPCHRALLHHSSVPHPSCRHGLLLILIRTASPCRQLEGEGCGRFGISPSSPFEYIWSGTAIDSPSPLYPPLSTYR